VLERLEGTGSPARLEDLPLFAAVQEPPAKFEPSPADKALAALDPDAMSPREALEALYRLKSLGG
jgi:DNA mismatch repair protein MutS